MIIVSPYIVHARVGQRCCPGPTTALPTPSDPAAVLLGRLNRIYGGPGAADGSTPIAALRASTVAMSASSSTEMGREETIDAVRHPRYTSRAARSWRAAAAVVLAGTALTACQTLEPASPIAEVVAPSIPTDYRLRHPIKLREGNRAVELFVGSHRTDLTPSQRAQVMALRASAGTRMRPAASPSAFRPAPRTRRPPRRARAGNSLRFCSPPASRNGIVVTAQLPSRRHQLARSARISEDRRDAPVRAACGPPISARRRGLDYIENQPTTTSAASAQHNLAADARPSVRSDAAARPNAALHGAPRPVAFDKYRKGESPATVLSRPRQSARSAISANDQTRTSTPVIRGARHDAEAGRITLRRRRGSRCRRSARPRETAADHPICRRGPPAGQSASCNCQMGGIAAAVEAYRASPTPNVIMLESERSRGDRHSAPASTQLAEVCDPGTKVVVIGRHNDIALYRELMRRGVSEYLVPPLQHAAPHPRDHRPLHAARRQAGRPHPRLRRRQGRRRLLDPRPQHRLGRRERPAAQHGDRRLRPAVRHRRPRLQPGPAAGRRRRAVQARPARPGAVDRMMARCTDRLSLFAAPATLDATTTSAPKPSRRSSQDPRAPPPYVVLDLPHLWSGWMRRMLICADDVVIVAAPDLASLRNAKNIIDLVRAGAAQRPPPGWCSTRSACPAAGDPGQGLRRGARDCSRSLVMPFDAKLFGQAANNGQMIAEVAPKPRPPRRSGTLAQILDRPRRRARRQRGGLFDAVRSKLLKR